MKTLDIITSIFFAVLSLIQIVCAILNTELRLPNICLAIILGAIAWMAYSEYKQLNKAPKL